MYFETGQGSRAVGRRALDGRRPADPRGARLRGGPPVRPAAGQHRRRVHRPGVPLRRQADHPRRAGGPLLRQAARPADGRRRLLHQPRRGRPGRHGHPADCCSASPGCTSSSPSRARDDIMLNYQSPRSTTRCTSGRCSACGRRRSSRRGWRGWACSTTRGRVPRARPPSPAPRGSSARWRRRDDRSGRRRRRPVAGPAAPHRGPHRPRAAPATACPPSALLEFEAAHAPARDAVHAPLDAAAPGRAARAGCRRLEVRSRRARPRRPTCSAPTSAAASPRVVGCPARRARRRVRDRRRALAPARCTTTRPRR